MKTFEEWLKTVNFPETPRDEVPIYSYADMKMAWNGAVAERDAETCEWRENKFGDFVAACGETIEACVLHVKNLLRCPNCGKRIVMKGSEVGK